MGASTFFSVNLLSYWFWSFLCVMPGKVQPKDTSVENLRSALPGDASAIALSNGGFAASMRDLKVLGVETIGGVRVVEEQTVDKLLRAIGSVLIRHAQWRAAVALRHSTSEEDPLYKNLKNKQEKARLRYRRARAFAHAMLHEVAGMSVNNDTLISPQDVICNTKG